jgi:hypothetical protein
VWHNADTLTLGFFLHLKRDGKFVGEFLKGGRKQI